MLLFVTLVPHVDCIICVGRCISWRVHARRYLLRGVCRQRPPFRRVLVHPSHSSGAGSRGRRIRADVFDQTYGICIPSPEWTGECIRGRLVENTLCFFLSAHLPKKCIYAETRHAVMQCVSSPALSKVTMYICTTVSYRRVPCVI